MKKHFIFDMETLGTNTQKCVVLDCSWITFDWNRFTENPYTLVELISLANRAKLDVKSQVDFGYKIEPDTLKWWGEQGPEARKKISPKADDIDINTFMERLISTLDNDIQYWWARSNTFDPMILERLARDHGYNEKLNNLLKFWNVRDTRTFIDSKTNFNRKLNSFVPIADAEHWDKTFVKHDSSCDIAADILRLQTLTRLDNGLEGTQK